MNDTTSKTPMLTETTAENPQEPIAGEETGLEQQMENLALSSEAKRFLRSLHLAERQLNDAFNKGRQAGELEERVSQVYHDLYGAGCASKDSC